MIQELTFIKFMSSSQESTGPDRNWPFDQPPNCAVFTLRSIVFDGQPILHVSHDLDDHGWQFLGGGDAEYEDAAIVSFSEILTRDPTLYELADLRPGWHAWRSTVESKWQRAVRPAEWET
jgi:hypothetical protein